MSEQERRLVDLESRLAFADDTVRSLNDIVAKQQLHLAAGESLDADLISLIPPQEAATIAHRADVVDASGWCPVDPVGFESSRHPGLRWLKRRGLSIRLPARRGHAPTRTLRFVR